MVGRKRILIVEDDPVNCEFLETFLTSNGYACTSTKTGEDAIAHFDGPPFDLILLDIMLPGKTGAEVAWTARQRGMTTPIVAVSAAFDRWDPDDLADLGIDRTVAKPFENEDLLREVEQALASPREHG